MPKRSIFAAGRDFNTADKDKLNIAVVANQLINTGMFLRAVVLGLLCSLTFGTVANDIDQAPSDNRVTIELYYETLCPYCHQFLTTQMVQVMAQPVIPR